MVGLAVRGLFQTGTGTDRYYNGRISSSDNSGRIFTVQWCDGEVEEGLSLSQLASMSCMPASYKAKHSKCSNNAEGLAETTSVMRECPTAQTSIVGIVT
jgi:hypothetical protein